MEGIKPRYGEFWTEQRTLFANDLANYLNEKRKEGHDLVSCTPEPDALSKPHYHSSAYLLVWLAPAETPPRLLEPYTELDAALRSLVDGYTLAEVLERFAEVVKALPAGPDVVCRGGSVFSESAYHQEVTRGLRDLAGLQEAVI